MADVMVKENGEVKRARHTAKHTPFGINLVPVAIDDVGRERTCKDPAERIVREIRVARVHTRNVLSAGVTSTLIDGIVYALVRLGAPISKQCLIGFDEFAATVGAATVDDKPFIVTEVLSLDRCNRAGQSPRLL